MGFGPDIINLVALFLVGWTGVGLEATLKGDCSAERASLRKVRSEVTGPDFHVCVGAGDPYLQHAVVNGRHISR